MSADRLGAGQIFHTGPVVPLVFFAVALLALTRARPMLEVVAAMALCAYILVGYTPLTRLLVPSASGDPLQPCPAIVVLSSTVRSDRSLDAQMEARALQGWLLLRRGYGRRLVFTRDVTHPFPPMPVVKAEMAGLGLDYPVEDVGPVHDTHDEAVATAALARARGWRRVILVTQSWHMRRAAAVFKKAGIAVLRAPCTDGEYDMNALKVPNDRFRTFANWLHEEIGYRVYQWRGWI